MYDIEELEKQWAKYRQRKRRPWIVGTIGVIVAVSAFFYLIEEDFVLHSINSKKEKVDSIHHHTKSVLLDGPLAELETKDVLISNKTSLVEVLPDNELEQQKGVSKKEKHIKLKFDIVEANDPHALKEIEKRFRLGHDVDDSLFLAKTYFAKGQYKKAEYWALQTNKIDDGMEEGWLIFVKSKLKQGQRNEALRILSAYVKKTHSAEAKVLLEKIQKAKR